MNYEKCDICPHLCGVNRYEKRGFCGGGVKASVTRAALHFWEEPVISGEKGSGTVFFSGCTMRCVFCQNFEISRTVSGNEYDGKQLADVFLSLEEQGANNINLVNPVHFSPTVKDAIIIAKNKGLSVPVLWNSGGYDRAETLREFDGLIDIYLPDFKYRSDEKAVKYSAAPNYAITATEAINEMYRQVGEPIIENGLMKKGVIVRHLILPGLPLQSVKALHYIKENLPEKILVSLMAQFIPAGEVSAEKYPELNRRITHGEYSTVLREYEALGFDGFIQELTAADKAFVPKLKE